jgi:ADP-ribose pyrophosphatase YjhB (NUDIX family)
VGDSHAHWIDDAEWARVRELVPITCVDLVPVRDSAAGVQFGLIERDSPFGLRWCQIGGRLRHGETMRAGLLRHLLHTLAGLDVELPADPQPDYTMQWFPDPPADGVSYGLDPRQHAVALCFLARVADDAAPTAVEGGEAVRFGWFTLAEVDALGDTAWPGTAAMIRAIAPRV